MAKVKTGLVRLSYPHLAQARESDDGGKAKYSATLLIPKTDSETVLKIKNAIADATAEYKEKNGAQSLPPKPKNTLHDGDGTREDGTEFAPECKGHFVITANTVRPPLLVDQRRQEIQDGVEDVFYPGCYVVAVLNFKVYEYNGKKGITAYLNGLQFAKDGEPLGSAKMSASEFDELSVEIDEDDDFWA